jgi:hypothetical protein
LKPNSWQITAIAVYALEIIIYALIYPRFPSEWHFVVMMGVCLVYSAGWLLGRQRNTNKAPLYYVIFCVAHGSEVFTISILFFVCLIYFLVLIEYLSLRFGLSKKVREKDFNKLQLLAMIGFFIDLLLLIVTGGNSIILHIPFLVPFTVMFLMGWSKAYLSEQSKPISLLVLIACLLLGTYFYAVFALPLLLVFYLILFFVKRSRTQKGATESET